MHLGRAVIKLAALAICLLMASQPALARPKKVKEAPDILKPLEQRITKGHVKQDTQNLRQLYSAKWLEAGTNFSSIFLSQKGPLNLLEWVGDLLPGFSKVATDSTHESEFVGATRLYKDDNFNEIALSILVPHPKYVAVTGMGLVPAFSKLEPPLLHIAEEESVVVHKTFQGKIYAHDDGFCSLLIKLPRSSVVNLSAKTCHLKDQLKDLAEKLDIERLAMKLQS